MRPSSLPSAALALLVPLVLPGLSGCGEKEKVVSSVVAKNTLAVPVEVATLESAAFRDTLDIVGRVEAYESVRITAELPGRIEAVPFGEGETVRRGQTVARIDAKIAAAQQQQAAAQFDLAKATLTRTEKLSEKGLATPAQLEMAKAQAAQADAALALTNATLDKAVILAPISGVVTKVNAKRGEVAGPGVPLLQIVRVDKVKVTADAPERDVPLLDVGTDAAITAEAFPGRDFVGTVETVGLVANPKTRTFLVTVALNNADGALRPGMLASVRLLRKELREVVVIPRDAVLDETDGKSIYVDNQGVAERRSVEVGAVRGRFAVVRSGLSVGDRLVVLGHRQVVDGQTIEIKAEATCCAKQVAAVREEEGTSPPQEVPSAEAATVPAKAVPAARAKVSATADGDGAG